ncbi:MAG TPA: hypothetical protein VJ885_02255 [Thermoanaerobaculia bacterium]|nr:hypothetical protein [Thermoanaerobaculia bacterium]
MAMRTLVNEPRRQAAPAILALALLVLATLAGCKAAPGAVPSRALRQTAEVKEEKGPKTKDLKDGKGAEDRKKNRKKDRKEAREETAADRKRRYLDISHRQMKKFSQVIRLNEERLGPAALSAAALAAAGKPTREEAIRWTNEILDRCATRQKCDSTWMAMQRVVLQYPEALPPDLLERVRAVASRVPQPPGEQAVREPWSFKETENQRIVRMALNVVAFRLAPPPPGSPRAAAEKGWTEATEAFLLAHDREGWYEAESPGYIAASMHALLHLTDHAKSERVRELAARQLNLLFAEWAQEQVRGFPAGVKSRTYVQWALGTRNTPWLAWAWLAGGIGDPEKISFMDWPEIGTSSYQIPAPVGRLIAERADHPPYEIRSRRSIDLGKRRDLHTALYSFATPDYILGAAQSVGGLQLGVSGGQEIMATLYASCADFAPIYLWSRTQNPRSDRWRSWSANDLAMAHRNIALARLGVGSSPGKEAGEETIGHAYLSPPWSQPEILGGKEGNEQGSVLVSRCGDTYVALVTEDGWEAGPAAERFPTYYAGDKTFRGSWAAVPRRQPAAIALEVGRRAEHGSFEQWKKRAANARLTLAEGELRFTASDGAKLSFLPGEKATVGGRPLQVDYPLLAGPFLNSAGSGRWTFSFDGVRHQFEAMSPRPAP